MRKAYIVAAKRSAIGSFMGGLTNIKLVDLGATVLKETIKQSGIDPKDIDEALVGNVIAGRPGDQTSAVRSASPQASRWKSAPRASTCCAAAASKAVMEATLRIQAGFATSMWPVVWNRRPTPPS